MTLITKALSILLALAVLAGGVLIQRNQSLTRSLQAERDKVAVLDHTLTATRNSLNVYMARARATAARAEQNQKEVRHALDTNPDWRDGAVPDAVFDGLYKNRGAPRDAARNAAGGLP